MQSPFGGPVKIGCSDNLEKRHAQLEAYYGQPLLVLTTMEGDKTKELEIHRRFAHLRLGRTEQFQPAPSLMEFIGSPSLADANPAILEAMMPVQTPVAIVIRGKPEWRDWVKQLAEFDGCSVNEVIRRAARDRAKDVGFTKAEPNFLVSRNK